MQTVWRLVTARYAESAFSGEGARLYGGRWNRKGTAMVYTAGSQSLALLEAMVQDQPLRARYVMLPATFPEDITIERIAPEQLPAEWRERSACEELQKIGGDWIKRGSSAVLSVPSTVIPTEINYLLNPLHPAFIEIIIGPPQELVTDLRLLKKYSAAG